MSINHEIKKYLNRKTILLSTAFALGASAICGCGPDRAVSTEPAVHATNNPNLAALPGKTVSKTIKHVTLDASMGTLENVALNPLELTDADSAHYLVKSQEWDYANLIINQRDNVDPELYIGYVDEHQRETGMYSKAVLLSTATVSTIAVDGDHYDTVNDLLRDAAKNSNGAFDSLAQLYVHTDAQQPVIN